jgi:Tol biopolymer transport system component
VFQQASPDTGIDIGVVPIEGEHTVTMLISSPADEGHPAVSPDGRWIAYHSNQSGRWEVYVQPFPEMIVVILNWIDELRRTGLQK